MPGHMKYRTLGRDSAHRQALLRNLVTSLFKNDSISTTWHKAKEAQRLAEKVVTLAKRNTAASRRRVEQILYTPVHVAPRIFSTIRERYLDRPGGYTRVLRIEPIKYDQAPSAILELVDGDRDMRFTLTAQTVARDRMLGKPHHPMTLKNRQKVIAFRENGEKEFEEMVQKFVVMEEEGVEGTRDIRKESIGRTTSIRRGRAKTAPPDANAKDVGRTRNPLSAKSLAKRMAEAEGY